MKKQQLSVVSDANEQVVGVGQIRGDESDVAKRLAEVLDNDSIASFSRRSGVPESNLRSYVKRGIKPGLDHLVAIADAADVNVLWLAAGRGPKKGSATPAPAEPTQPLDVARLTRAIAAVQEGLQAINRTLAPQKHAELVLAAYELLESPATSASNVIKFIKAAA
jgi:hypothetical protein